MTVKVHKRLQRHQREFMFQFTETKYGRMACLHLVRGDYTIFSENLIFFFSLS